jgi:hypothetical protein
MIPVFVSKKYVIHRFARGSRSLARSIPPISIISQPKKLRILSVTVFFALQILDVFRLFAAAQLINQKEFLPIL